MQTLHKYLALLTLLTLPTLVPLSAFAGLPDKGSFFVSLVDTNMSLTNVFYIPASCSSNLPVALVRAIPVADCTSVVLMADLVSTNAAGATNNAPIRFNVELSTDGVTFTTPSNGVFFAAPTAGTVRWVTATNPPASVFSGYEYMRLSSIVTTNLGAWYLTNLWYRLVR